jgi:hypothetical protein
MHLDSRMTMDERFSATQLMIQMANDQTFVTAIDQPVQ